MGYYGDRDTYPGIDSIIFRDFMHLFILFH